MAAILKSAHHVVTALCVHYNFCFPEGEPTSYQGIHSRRVTYMYIPTTVYIPEGVHRTRIYLTGGELHPTRVYIPEG